MSTLVEGGPITKKQIEESEGELESQESFCQSNPNDIP